MRRIFAPAFLFLFLALSARADVVELNDGTIIEGRIEDVGDSIRIHKKGGSVTIPKRLIKKITKKETPEEIYEKKAVAVEKGDIQGHLKLARWCEDQNIPTKAEREYRKVLEIDSDHEIAREALGYRKYKGKWMSEADVNKAKGLVRHKGRWMTPAEKALEEALDEKRKMEEGLRREVKTLLRKVRSRKPEEVLDAKNRLDEIDDEYKTRDFLKAISTTFKATRLYVVQEVGKMKLNDAVKPLARRVIYDKEKEIRKAAMDSLRMINLKGTHNHWTRLLNDANDIIRLRAIEALAVFPEWASVAPLLLLLDKDVRTITFIEQYQDQLERILAGKLVTKDGRHVPFPRGARINTEYFDKEGLARLHREVDSIRASLRAITGSDFGRDMKAWGKWYEKESKDRAAKKEDKK